ncbi:hypothetical protein L0337_24255 [candidate division KSB1 bacterium]|nr:hypothetical protein [candidate division KSB1 bacterium]
MRVLSPVDGEVIETGGPDKGWYLRVKPNGADENMRHLLRGAEIRPWIMRELERLQLALAPEGIGMSLADGGVPVEDLSQGYPEADWDTVLGDMFWSREGCCKNFWKCHIAVRTAFIFIHNWRLSKKFCLQQKKSLLN